MERRIADVIGGLMEAWGFKRIMGRLWTVLYLSPQPLSAGDLARKLQASTGAISMTLGDLQKWGVVKKTWRLGERRDYYEPETSIWKMVSRVFRERELVLVREAIEAFSAATASLEGYLGPQPRARTSATASAARPGPPKEDERARFALDRVRALHKLARIGEGLLHMLLAGQPIDARPMSSLSDRPR